MKRNKVSNTRVICTETTEVYYIIKPVDYDEERIEEDPSNISNMMQNLNLNNNKNPFSHQSFYENNNVSHNYGLNSSYVDYNNTAKIGKNYNNTDYYNVNTVNNKSFVPNNNE